MLSWLLVDQKGTVVDIKTVLYTIAQLHKIIFKRQNVKKSKLWSETTLLIVFVSSSICVMSAGANMRSS